MSKWSLIVLAYHLFLALAQPPFVLVQTSIAFILRRSATLAKHQPVTMPGGVAILYPGDQAYNAFYRNLQGIRTAGWKCNSKA